MTDWPFWSTWNQIFLGSSWPLISCYLFLRSTPTPQPITPLNPNRRGPRGGPGGLNKGGDLMSLTPKCDMFLEIPWEDQTENVGKIGNIGIRGKLGQVGKLGKVGKVGKERKVGKVERVGKVQKVVKCPNGSKWVKMAPNGFEWLQMALNGSKWFQMAPHSSKCSKWLQIVSNCSKLL